MNSRSAVSCQTALCCCQHSAMTNCQQALRCCRCAPASCWYRTKRNRSCFLLNGLSSQLQKPHTESSKTKLYSAACALLSAALHCCRFLVSLSSIPLGSTCHIYNYDTTFATHFQVYLLILQIFFARMYTLHKTMGKVSQIVGQISDKSSKTIGKTLCFRRVFPLVRDIFWGLSDGFEEALKVCGNV